MKRLEELKTHLKRGQVYRRDELTMWSKSIDRHLEALIKDGTLEKLSQGLYYCPKVNAFGKVPPAEEILIRSVLKDDRFLLTSLSNYNTLGVGTTQLYNERVVYNHKRHGDFKLGNKKFSFRIKPQFPSKITKEFLLVDLVNNLESLAEDPTEVLKNIALLVSTTESKTLNRHVSKYGNAKTKKILSRFVKNKSR